MCEKGEKSENTSAGRVATHCTFGVSTQGMREPGREMHECATPDGPKRKRIVWQGWCAGALALTGIRTSAGASSCGDTSFGVSSHAGGTSDAGSSTAGCEGAPGPSPSESSKCSVTADLRRQAGIAGASPTAFSEEVRASRRSASAASSDRNAE